MSSIKKGDLGELLLTCAVSPGTYGDSSPGTVYLSAGCLALVMSLVMGNYGGMWLNLLTSDGLFCLPSRNSSFNHIIRVVT
jgi:hypothetical protein